MDHFLKSLLVTEITPDEVHEIQENTIWQANNKQWIAERQKRLNSSRFGRICKMTAATDGHSLARSYLNEKDLHIQAITYGRTHEYVAVKKYEHKTGNSTTTCGLFVSQTHSFLSASPVRVVSGDLLLEVKCPFTARDAMITPATVPYIIVKDNDTTLDDRHDYYNQIQGQMFCAGACAVDFVVFTQADFKVFRIARNDVFIQNMVATLQKFFDSYFRPVLLDKFVAADYYEYIMCRCIRFNDCLRAVDNAHKQMQ